MSHPYYHSLSSSLKDSNPSYQFSWEDHYPIHHFLDSSKAHLADARHRCLFHHPTGVAFCLQLPSPLPPSLIRSIATRHIKEDLTHLPPLKKWIHPAPPYQVAEWPLLLSLSKPELLAFFEKKATSLQNLQERRKLLRLLLAPEEYDSVINHPSRFIYFTSPGPFLCESILGPVLPSLTPTRTLSETLIKELLGFVPSLQDFLLHTPIEDWMYKNALSLSKTTKIDPVNPAYSPP